MIKTRTIKIKGIKNEETLMAVTIIKMITTTEIMIIMIIKICNHTKIENR